MNPEQYSPFLNLDRIGGNSAFFVKIGQRITYLFLGDFYSRNSLKGIDLHEFGPTIVYMHKSSDTKRSNKLSTYYKIFWPENDL